MRLLISFLIWIYAFIPVVVIGYPITAILLLTSWQGFTTPWGNILYGRAGNIHIGTAWYSAWIFLAVRNPASNWGKLYLSVSPGNAWAWLDDKQIIGRFYIKHGWKLPDDRIGGKRTFLFRPWIHPK